MKIYLVNSKYYYNSYDEALIKAKEILSDRSGLDIDHMSFSISKGKKSGYCVRLNADWQLVGNFRLLDVIIREIELNTLLT